MQLCILTTVSISKYIALFDLMGNTQEHTDFTWNHGFRAGEGRNKRRTRQRCSASQCIRKYAAQNPTRSCQHQRAQGSGAWIRPTRPISKNLLKKIIKEKKDEINGIGRHTVTLHKRSHLLTDRAPRIQLWQCSTSLFWLTCFYELSNQAFINYLSLVRHSTSSCNLSQSHITNMRPIWHLGRYIIQQINTCSLSRDTFDNPHTTYPGTNQISNRVWSPYLQRITPTISRRRHTKLQEGRYDDSLLLWCHLKPDSSTERSI